jgi:hypothetical protein
MGRPSELSRWKMEATGWNYLAVLGLQAGRKMEMPSGTTVYSMDYQNYKLSSLTHPNGTKIELTKVE